MGRNFLLPDADSTATRKPRHTDPTTRHLLTSATHPLSPQRSLFLEYHFGDTKPRLSPASPNPLRIPLSPDLEAFPSENVAPHVQWFRLCLDRRIVPVKTCFLDS
jgi:hypothetical protein